MSAIEASSVGVRTMADGTLRLTVDIEPRHARDAFELFGAPGVPMALAALKTATHAPEKPTAIDKPIAKWLALRCKEPAFIEWACDHSDQLARSEEAAAHWCRVTCGVHSRGEIDGSPSAEERFQRLIRGPWQKHCIATGEAA